MKKVLLLLVMIAGLQASNAAPAASDVTPKSVIHVITVSWKAGTTPDQIQAALDGVKALPAQYPGIVRVWVRSIKVQAGKQNAIVMEFSDEAALKTYADSAPQKEWYKVYQPIREDSKTFDITN